MKYKDLENELSIHWFQFIKDNPDKDWSWGDVSQNPNITRKIIKDNRDKPWDWQRLSANLNITLYKQRWINKRRLEHIKAFQIQRRWRNCSCNPEYKLAQRCLLRLHGS